MGKSTKQNRNRNQTGHGLGIGTVGNRYMQIISQQANHLNTCHLISIQEESRP